MRVRTESGAYITVTVDGLTYTIDAEQGATGRVIVTVKPSHLAPAVDLPTVDVTAAAKDAPHRQEILHGLAILDDELYMNINWISDAKIAELEKARGRTVA